MDSNVKVRFPGTKVNIAGTEYIVPPLGMAAYSKHNAFEKLQKIHDSITSDEKGINFGGFTKDVIQDILELIYLAIRRNYPQTTVEELEDVLDFATCMEMIPILIDMGKRASTEEETLKNVQKP